MDSPANQPTVILRDEGLRRLEGFTQIPNVVLTHPGLSGNAKITYGVLLSYAWQKDFCWPAQERLAQDTNCSVRTVQRYVTELETAGLIRVRRQGLNRPNIYEIMPISSWHHPPKAAKNKDTTDLSYPDTTELAHPDTTAVSPLDATPVSYKEDSVKKTQKVVNDVTANDQKSSAKGNRPPAAAPSISDRALRSKYGFTDDQIGQVHWLVEKQIEILGAAERNHGNYVKRAAEAVRDGESQALDHKLGDFKQASTAIAVGSRPAYFHAMWTEVLQKRGIAIPAPSERSTRNADDRPQRIGGLFGHGGADDDPERDRIAKILADAQSRGHRVPDFIRTSNNFAQVSRWWAALVDPAIKDR